MGKDSVAVCLGNWLIADSSKDYQNSGICSKPWQRLAGFEKTHPGGQEDFLWSRHQCPESATARFHPAANTKPAGEMHAGIVGLTPVLVSYPGYLGPKGVLSLLHDCLFLGQDPFLLSLLQDEALA